MREGFKRSSYELEHAGDEEEEVGRGVAVGVKDGELLEEVEVEVGTAHLLAGHVVQYQGAEVAQEEQGLRG